MSVSNQAIVGLMVTVLSSGVWCHSAAAQEPAAKGSQANDLAKFVSGYVIHTQGRELRAVSLPGRKATLVRRIADDDPDHFLTIHAVSGPDVKGRIAYIEDHFFVADEADRRHRLKVINVDGTRDTELFSRRGSAMWAVSRAGRGEIGTHIAISPTAGKVALLSGLSERQMPGALLQEGDIEIWDIEEKRRLPLTTRAINQPLSWFPDGQRLAYTKLVPRGELPASALGLDRFGTYFGQTWDPVPAIYVLELKTGAARFLHVGWTAVVSLKGNPVLVGGWDDRSEPPFSWNRFDIASRRSAAVKWPGDAGGAIAAPTSTTVLYRSLNGDTASTTSAAPFSIRLATIEDSEFETVTAGIGPHTIVSFGSVGRDER